jgi:uncharacterized coiled-coil protein SlyX
MRLTKLLVVLLLVPTMVWAQSSTGSTSTSADTPNVSDQINKLSDAIAAQQSQIAAQQEQMKKQQQELETLRKQLAEQKAAANNTPRVVDASLNATMVTNAEAAQAPPGGAQQPEAQGTGKTSPLSFRIGAAEFTPGGFLDFTNVFRTTNTGNILSTNFGANPFDNTTAGNLTEIRTTSQYSRLSLKVASKVMGADVTGYVETDFNGNDAANVFNTSNPHTFRLRLAYMELKKGPLQLIGGQTWGWLTPNRVGLGTAGADVFTTNNSDANINVGLPYTRPSSLHVILRPNSHFGWGFGLETQQQFLGATTLPGGTFGTNGNFATQGDTAGGVAGTPSLHPAILTKLAYDSNPTGGHNVHLELTGIMNSVKIAFTPVGAPTGTFTTNTKTGGGFEMATVTGLTKNFRLVANAFYGNGQGRQNIALSPDFVIRPNGDISLVHSGSGMAGVEAQVTPSTLFAFYYGAIYNQANYFRDTNATGQPFIGFGCQASVFGTVGIPFRGGNGLCPTNLAQNRLMSEPTLDIIHTFWKNPQWGSIGINLQTSYLSRSPWVVGQNPKNAHLFMQYVVLRYILP